MNLLRTLFIFKWMQTLKSFVLFLSLTTLGAVILFRILPLEVPLYTFTYLHGNFNHCVTDYSVSCLLIYIVAQVASDVISRRRRLKSSLKLVSSYPIFISLVCGILVALAHFNFRGYAITFLWPCALFALPTTFTLLIQDGWLEF